MGYYYRNRYSYKRNYYKSSSISQQSERKPKKDFYVRDYIKNEFFNADDETFREISNLYRQLYGYGAYKYMMDTFYNWKLGYVGLSGQTMYRILECVPKFLSIDKRFYILKCEILYFIENLHYQQQNKTSSLTQLNDLFQNYEKEVDNFNQVNLSWLVGKGIFSEIEIQQFLSICKYALQQKLNLSYRQVQNDLLLIKSKLANFINGTYKATYQIDFLTTSIDLSGLEESELEFIQLSKHELKLEGIFKQFAEEYILEELINMSFSEQTGEINHFIKAKDLDFFVSKYNEILEEDDEASLKSEFQGEGGRLLLLLELKSVKRTRTSLFFSGIKLILYLAALVAVVILIVGFKLYKASALNVIVVFIMLGGWVLIGIYIKGVVTEVKTLIMLITDLQRYGK